MARILYFVVTLVAVVGLAAINGSALAQPKDQGRTEQSNTKGNKGGEQQKVKEQKHHNGKDFVGDQIKKDGKHQFHQNGKHTAFVNVKGGKIAGVTVTHAEKGNVPVKKYKTSKKMAQADGLQYASFQLAQAQDLGSTYIGYAYVDDFGIEVIYWFPYEMILDGATGAIDYVPLY